MEVVLGGEEVLRGSRSSYENAIQTLLREEGLIRQVADLRVELVSGNLYQPLEPSCRLPSLAVLAWNERLDVLDEFNPPTSQETHRCLASVHNDEPVRVLLLQHLEKRFHEELRVASVEERRRRLGRFYHELNHLSLVGRSGFVADEEDDPVLRRPLVDFQPAHDGLYGGHHVLPRTLRFDVRRLRVLVSEIRHRIRYLLVRRDVERDELGTPALRITDSLEVPLELVSRYLLAHVPSSPHSFYSLNPSRILS